MDRNNRKYIEVHFGENGYDTHYRNPLTKTYQYEYALYLAVSELFASVKCKSGCIESLKLYFSELPEGSNGVADEMATLVQRDVAGSITFPMMHACAAEVRTRLEKDGTHTFIFSDGIYGFSVHLDKMKKGHPGKILVRDCYCV